MDCMAAREIHKRTTTEIVQRTGDYFRLGRSMPSPVTWWQAGVNRLAYAHRPRPRGASSLALLWGPPSRLAAAPPLRGTSGGPTAAGDTRFGRPAARFYPVCGLPGGFGVEHLGHFD